MASFSPDAPAFLKNDVYVSVESSTQFYVLVGLVDEPTEKATYCLEYYLRVYGLRISSVVRRHSTSVTSMTITPSAVKRKKGNRRKERKNYDV